MDSVRKESPVVRIDMPFDTPQFKSGRKLLCLFILCKHVKHNFSLSSACSNRDVIVQIIKLCIVFNIVLSYYCAIKECYHLWEWIWGCGWGVNTWQYVILLIKDDLFTKITRCTNTSQKNKLWSCILNLKSDTESVHPLLWGKILAVDDACADRTRQFLSWHNRSLLVSSAHGNANSFQATHSDLGSGWCCTGLFLERYGQTYHTV